MPMSLANVLLRIIVTMLGVWLVMVALDRMYRVGYQDGYWSHTLHFSDGTVDDPIEVPYAVDTGPSDSSHAKSDDGASQKDLVGDG